MSEKEENDKKPIKPRTVTSSTSYEIRGECTNPRTKVVADTTKPKKTN